ncbi:MAG: hypothetical protein KAG66_00485 [Methylococcales bacterium]|nr:hypothetical protein [Methylococcales bacterium]
MALQKIKISSQTVQVDYEEYLGDTLEITFNWKGADDQPVNLVGWSGVLQVKAEKTDTVALIERSTGDGSLVLSDGTGEFNIETELTPAETLGLGLGTKTYDLQLTSPAGKVNTLVIGGITITQDTSR